MLSVVYCLGIEPVLIGPSDPRGACPLGVNVAHSFSPAPSWKYKGLPEAKGAALHSEHRRHPHLPGRVYT